MNYSQLEILYNGRPLAAEYKLSDVAYIFSWKEVRPFISIHFERLFNTNNV